MRAPMIQCSLCQTPYIAKWGISIATGDSSLAWYPECKHKGKTPDFVVAGGDNPTLYDASKLGITDDATEKVGAP